MTTLDDRLSAAVSEIKEVTDRAPLPMPGAVETRRSRVRVPALVVAGVAAALVLLIVGIPILLLAGGDSTVVDEPTTTVVSTTLPPTTMPPTTMPSTTTPPSTVPSTWLQPRLFYMVWGPVDGQYTNTGVLGSDGAVRPLASVTLNGSPAETEWCGAWTDDDDIYCWGIGASDEESPMWDEVQLGVDLDEGPNTLVYEATFDDGETMQLLLDIVYDPTLNSSEGWLVDVVAGDPPLAVLAVVDLERGESDLTGIVPIDVVGEPRQVTLPIATDGAFIILDLDRPNNRTSRLLTTDEFLELIATVKAGGTTDFLYSGYLIPEEGMLRGWPSTFLTNTDGELQQMQQWWSNDDRWSRP